LTSATQPGIHDGPDLRSGPGLKGVVEIPGVGDGVGLVGGVGRQGAHVIEMQRRRLLLAFVELVSEQGLDGAGIGPVCKRAGVSRRTFYEIFEDREACVLAALEAGVQRIIDSVLPAYEHEHKWSARIRAGLLALLECFDEEPGIARLCVVESLRAGPEVSVLRKRILDTLAKTVDEGRNESRRDETLPSLTAQGTVGGALSVIHTRLLEEHHAPLTELARPLTAMIIHPYLGPAAARRELKRPTPPKRATTTHTTNDPFNGLSIRFTYRTALVLATIAKDPRASNRHIAETAGITDEGQTSRLLRRLQQAGLIENHGNGHTKGEANAWTLTKRGEAVQEAISGRTPPRATAWKP
jgi:AcrR family transcriptional regulator/DNA-binding MarR family transcriptional regulator